MIIDLKNQYENFVRDQRPLAKYPGVTRVLSATKDNTGLDLWRQRVGEEEAERIMVEAQNIGTSLDTMVNDYLGGTSLFEAEAEYAATGKKLFGRILPWLKKIEPMAVQAKVWSDHLKIMGYSDCIGLYDGVLSVIDIKNSKKPKLEEYLEDYWLQTTAYSMCMFDMIGFAPKQVVLIIALREEAYPQVVKKPIAPFIPKVLQRVHEYYRIPISNLQ